MISVWSGVELEPKHRSRLRVGVGSLFWAGHPNLSSSRQIPQSAQGRVPSDHLSAVVLLSETAAHGLHVKPTVAVAFCIGVAAVSHDSPPREDPRKG